MNKKNRMKTALSLTVVLGIFAVFGGSLQAAVTIYEPFDYTAGSLLTGSGGTGFDGAWVTTEGGTGENYFTVKDGGLSSTIGLEVAGNSVYRTASGGRSEANRAISAASQAALLADGSTIWFSVLYQKTATDGRAAFVIGTDMYDVAAGGNLYNFTAGGEGFGFGSSNDRLITAIAYDDSAGLTEVDSTVDASTVKLIAGKIIWDSNGIDDELYLYEVTDLFTEPTTPIATVTADLDQSAFDLVVLQHSYNNTTLDEIRIGTKYNDVTGGPVYAGDNMITVSGLAVPLAPSFIGGYTPTSYLWTTDAPAGFTVEWDPSATVEAPTVTITQDTPSNPSTVTLTLLVNGSDEDTMKIDVYDDSCLAAEVTGTLELDPTDIDENCVTNMADFAGMAKTWLDDYTLTAPAPKP